MQNSLTSCISPELDNHYGSGKGVVGLGFSSNMGIDLGTATVLVYQERKGIVLNEPSVVAIEQRSRKVLAVGVNAQKMLGRTPGNIVTIRPLKEGVIADFDITEAMLRHFINQVTQRRRFFRPRVVVCIPSGTTAVEQKAVIEGLSRAGVKETFLIEEPRAAALGAGLEIFEPSGSMIIDIGGGTTDVAVLSMGEIVVSTCVRIGGDKLDSDISQYVKKKYKLLIGERSAEKLKKQIGSILPDDPALSLEVRGRDTVAGLPRSLTITSAEVAEALEESVWAIMQGVKQVLESTPPELAGDIVDKGVVMTGGGSLLGGLDRFIAREIGIPVYLADDPITCVARGTGKVLEYIDRLSPTLINSRKVAASF